MDNLENVNVIEKPFVCAFTGHRPSKLAFGYNDTDNRCFLLKEKIKEEIERLADSGVKAFISGMAQGVDMWSAEIIISLKKTTRPDLVLYCVLPCKEYNKNWDNKTYNKASTILKSADKVICLSQNYYPGCMLRRDKWMVDRADTVLAVLNGSMAYRPDKRAGGTAYTVDYASSLRKRVITIDPEVLFAEPIKTKTVNKKELLPEGKFVEER